MAIIITAIIFFSMVIIHEMAHMISADIFGVKTSEFSVGMGPRIMSKEIDGTKYSIKLFPMGGSCEMKMEEVDKLPFWQQATILLAGCASNILLGIVLLLLALVSCKGLIGGILTMPRGIAAIFSLMGSAIDSIKEMGLRDIGGPVKALTTVKEIATGVSHPTAAVLFLNAMLSFGMGLFNLLPVPPLDGGEVAYRIIRKLTGEHRLTYRIVTSLAWGSLVALTAMTYLNDIGYVFGKLATP